MFAACRVGYCPCRMLSLSDQELDVVIRMGGGLPLEKRDVYLQRIAALLQQRAGRHSTSDVIEAAETALRTLIQREAVA